MSKITHKKDKAKALKAKIEREIGEFEKTLKRLQPYLPSPEPRNRVKIGRWQDASTFVEEIQVMQSR